MSSVVSMLEGKTIVEKVMLDSNEALDEMKLEAMRQYYRQREENKIREIQN